MQFIQTQDGIAYLLPADGGSDLQVCFFESEFDSLQACLDAGAFAQLSGDARTLPIIRRAPFEDLVGADSVGSLPPLCAPQQFVIAGLNYRAHCVEIGRPVPDKLVFGAAPGSAAHVHHQPVHIPASAPGEVDYEGEIGVVIGAPAHNIKAADAWQVVAGLVPLNDVSARDVQAGGTMEALAQAKGFATFKPFGPVLATLDEFADPLSINVTTWVNGEQRQRGDSSDMVFPIPDIIAAVTRRYALLPGDIICTGTPGGVAHGGAYPYLQPGDVVEIELGGLPRLCNRFEAEPAA